MAQAFRTRPEIRGSFGAVSSTHWIASAVGMGVLERGGNAFDAAVAGGFTLQVVEPHLNGPGGEVPILAMRPGEAAPTVICGQGVAPASLTAEAVRERGYGAIPGTGLVPACVPGAFDAWMLLLRDWGTISLREALSPAIGYARNGFPIVHRAAAAIHAGAEHFRAHWPHSAEVWLADGPPMPGRTVATPQIADSYYRLLTEAEAASTDRIAQIEAARGIFYRGFVAEAIDTICRAGAPDGDGRPATGLLTADDLGSWQATTEGHSLARLCRRHRAQDRRLGPGPCLARDAGDPRGLRPRRHGPGGP